MNEAISLCGFNCGLCPAYKLNLQSEEDRIKVDKGWKKFHKTRGWLYKDPHCVGCFNNRQKAPLWRSCSIRKCVFGNNIDNCGYCLDYPCPRINNMIHIINLIAERTNKDGTEEDFQKFALPYQSKSRLDEIHQKFIETTPDTEYHPDNATTISFPSLLNPETLTGILKLEKSQDVLEYLHSILESILTLHCRTHGGQEQELKRNKEKLKFLWVVGKNGKLQTKDGYSIEITTAEIKERLRYGKYRTQRKLEEFAHHGIENSYIKDKITIKFSEKPETAIVLQNYIKYLLANYKKRTAYTRFWKADMSIFTE